MGAAAPPEPWSRWDAIVMAAITVFAGVLRVARLGAPPGRIFDEFYAVDACYYVRGAAASCETQGEITAVHPPLAKWLIAVGIRLDGYTPSGWRIASVVAGTLTVAIVYLLARELMRSVGAAAMASGLLAIDPLHFVMSRVAMLDVFVTCFATCAVLFICYDRRRLLRREPRRRHAPGVWGRPWRLAAGAAAGAAAASKWSGWFVLAAVVAASLTWERSIRRGSPGRSRGAWRAVIRDEGASLALGFVAIPILIYAVTFAGRLDGSLLAWPWSEGSWIRAFVARQVSMVRFHISLGGGHPSASPPWSWLLLKRPVSFFGTITSEGRYDQVMAVGSPIVWWASIAAMGSVAIQWIRHRAIERPYGVILLGFGSAYVPWLFLGISRGQTFLFYLLPAVPFMCLAVAAATLRIRRNMPGKAVISLFLVAATGWFAFSYPVLAAVALPRDQWMERMLFRDCAGVSLLSDAHLGGTQTSEGLTSTSASSGDPAGAPAGWCWL